MKKNIAIATIFIWIGFVLAISFMEAWLKFRAPGVTLPIGLGIGRLVFSALNKMEWIFSIICLITLLPQKENFTGIKLLWWIPILIVIVQTFWMLPALDFRAEMHIRGDIVPSSNLHFYYVILEFLKVGILVIFGCKLFNNKQSKVTLIKEIYFFKMEIASIFDKLEYGISSPVATVLINSDETKEIRIVFKKGQEMKEHKAGYPIVVAVIEGAINFGVGSDVFLLEKGMMIALEASVPHSLIAEQDSIVRLSLNKSDNVERAQKVVNR